jgi:hypothetical protein
MKRRLMLTALLALSALLCGCNDPNTAETEPSAVTGSSVSAPADCCGGDIPDCCKEKAESETDCCQEKEAADCCKEKEESDCCKEASKSDCCKNHDS